MDVSGIMLANKWDRLKNVNGGVAPEVMKYSERSDIGVFYPKMDLIKISEKADVFSLGIVLLRFLLGDRGIMKLSYNQGSCKDKQCFEQYQKDLLDLRVPRNEAYPPIVKLRELWKKVDKVKEKFKIKGNKEKGKMGGLKMEKPDFTPLEILERSKIAAYKQQKEIKQYNEEMMKEAKLRREVIR